jgi:hypothetical protein
MPFLKREILAYAVELDARESRIPTPSLFHSGPGSLSTPAAAAGCRPRPF